MKQSEPNMRIYDLNMNLSLKLSIPEKLEGFSHTKNEPPNNARKVLVWLPPIFAHSSDSGNILHSQATSVLTSKPKRKRGSNKTKSFVGAPFGGRV